MNHVVWAYQPEQQDLSVKVSVKVRQSKQCEPCGLGLSTGTTGAVSQSQCEGKAIKTV